jgi:hypothetical protein
VHSREVGDCRIFLHADLAHESEDRRIAQFGRLIRAAALSAGGSMPRTRLKRAVRARTLFVAAIAMVAPQQDSWMWLFL